MEPKITSDFRYTSRFCYRGLFVSYFCQKLIRSGILEASWRDLEGILGVSWLHFSSQNGPWRLLGGFLVLISDQLGSILGPETELCGELGPILPSKTDPKARNSNFSYNFNFCIVFGFHFGGGLNVKS